MKSLGLLHKKEWTLKVGLAVLTTVAVAAAHAEPVKPVGAYSESKIEGTTPTTGAVAVKPVPKKPAAPKTVAGEAKAWVKEKWDTLKSFTSQWMGNKPASTTVAKKAPQPSRAPASPGGGVPQPQVYVPPQPVGQKLAAPTGSPSEERGVVDPPGMTRSSSGVAVYDLGTTEEVPRLAVEKEEKYSSSRWALDGKSQKIMDERVIHPFESPELLTTTQMKALTSVTTGKPGSALAVKDPVFAPKGKVSRAEFDKIVIALAPEAALKLKKFVPLTQEELRFLSGLLLYQQGDKCAAAVGLFHQLSKAPGWEPEADYYLAMCSRKLGLETDFMERARRILEAQDVHYSKKILKEIGSDIPYEFTDTFGLALFKASSNAKIMESLDADTKANVAYLLTEFGASTERFKTALTWAKQVPANHPKKLQARFLEALAEYQSGSKTAALKIQEDLINDLQTDKAKIEFQALVALNVARMYFQEKDFKNAHSSFLKVYKDHPMWLQSLTELGWAQLQSGDFEGAIGNMYSIHSPFFSAAYKPESFVIRTIGYLNLCQYGDAYRTLSILERDYRPWLDQMEKFSKSADGKSGYYQTVKNLLNAQRSLADKKGAQLPKDIDGLPVPVVREMARHKDFTNLQKALNRQIDERPIYDRLDGEVQKSLKRAQWLVNNSRKRTEELRKKIGSIKKNPQLEQNRLAWQAELQRELDTLNDHFFNIDLFNEAMGALPVYKADVAGGADKRIASMRTKMEKILATRLLRLKTDLARMLENNELLRYEVFAGSGENIRYQVAGGEKGNRVPASVIPKSKSLQWDFDGEYWEDEIGHYRSSLKNNCPETQHHDTAALDGGAQ